MGSCGDDTGECEYCGGFRDSMCDAAIEALITGPHVALLAATVRAETAETAERERDEARAMLGLARSVVAAVRAQMDWKPESATEAMFYDYACQEMPGAFWCTVTDVYNAAQLLSDAITRLDHHRDGGVE